MGGAFFDLNDKCVGSVPKRRGPCGLEGRPVGTSSPAS